MVSKIIKKENLLENIIRVICYISIPLCFLMCLTLLPSYFLNGSISSDVNKMTSLGQVIMCFSIPMFISLVILPVLVKLFLQKEKLYNIGFHRPKLIGILFCIAFLMVVVWSYIRLENNPNMTIPANVIIIQFLVVAISEEIILRGVIMDELDKIFQNKYASCIVNAAIFAFIYHSSETFSSNLCVRFPLGLILGILRVKSGEIYSPIMLHWAYNMFIISY